MPPAVIAVIVIDYYPTKKHPCQVQKLSRGVSLLIQNGPCPMQLVVPNAVPIAVRILTSI